MYVKPLRLVLWYWLGAWECTPPQGFMLDSPWCQFEWGSLAFLKQKQKMYVNKWDMTYDGV